MGAWTRPCCSTPAPASSPTCRPATTRRPTRSPPSRTPSRDRKWWAEQWPEGEMYVAGLVAQDVQDALIERSAAGRSASTATDAPLHALHIQPDLGGPDPVWVCEETGREIAPLGELRPPGAELQPHREPVGAVDRARDLDDLLAGRAPRRECRSTAAPASTSSISASSALATSALIESSAQVGRRPRALEGVVQAGRHPALQEAGDQHLVEVGVLDAHRHTVGAAQPPPVDDGVTLGDAQRPGDTGTGLLATGEQRLRLRQQAAARHLLGVADQPARPRDAGGPRTCRARGCARAVPRRPVRPSPVVPSSGRPRSDAPARAPTVPVNRALPP